MPRRELGTYKSPATVISDGVHAFLNGLVYGGIWGLFAPYHAPGTAGAAAEAATGIFKPAPPFSSLRSVAFNASIVGPIMGVHRLSSRGLELARGREDYLNDVFGLGVAYKYYSTFLGSSDRRLMLHNRAVGGLLVAAIAYANLAV